MTPEQQQAIAIAAARARAAGQQSSGRSVPAHFARGATNSLIEAAGAVPELAAAGLRQISPALAPPSGYYPQAMRQGIDALIGSLTPGNSVSGSMQPVSGAEKFAFGAGRGVGDVASFLVPGAALAKGAQAGGTAARVGQAMTQGPTMQAAAGAIGGGTSEASDSGLAGLAAALATPAGVAGLRRAVSPVGNQLTQNEQQIVQIAKDLGIELTPGQATGSKVLQGIESTLTNMPFAGGNQQAIYQAQREGINQAAMAKAGVPGVRNITPEAIDSVFSHLGSQYDDLARQISVPATPNLFSTIEQVAQDYGRRLPSDVKPIVQSYVDDFAAMQSAANAPGVTGAAIEGPEFLRIMSDMKRTARSTNNPALKEALNGLVGTLDDAMVASAPPGVADVWRQTNQQYRNLKAIEQASLGAGADASKGNLPLAGLRQAIKQQDPSGYARGRGDLNEIGQLAAFLSPRIPDSGTAQRAMWQNLLTGGAFGGGAGVAAGADPMTTAAAGAAGLALPYIAQQAINSPVGSAYLKNQLLPQLPNQGQTIRNILTEQLLGGLSGGL